MAGAGAAAAVAGRPLVVRGGRAAAPRPRVMAVVAMGHRERRPFSRPINFFKQLGGIPASLFAPVTGELPEDGQFLTAAEESCNPEERLCTDPYYVYESKCAPCYGTGSVRSGGGRRGRRSSLCTCPQCHGLGVVRRTTSRFFPPDVEENPETIARTVLDADVATTEDEVRASNPTLQRKPPSFFRAKYGKKKEDDGLGLGGASSQNGTGPAAKKDSGYSSGAGGFIGRPQPADKERGGH